jgi:DNA mismatch endonuclease (patch repair protein)
MPGRPDIVFPARKKVIFVHGCFWHGHRCALGRVPKSNVDFWLNKIDTNRNRDKKNVRKLRTLGWHALAIWECQLRNEEKLKVRIKTFLDKGSNDQS